LSFQPTSPAANFSSEKFFSQVHRIQKQNSRIHFRK